MTKERKLAVNKWVQVYERDAVFTEPFSYYKRLLEAHATLDILDDIRIMESANVTL